MAIRKILYWPNDVLRCESTEVGTSMGFDSPALRQLTEDLLETVKFNRGLGLAAIQIGVDLRVFVMDVPGEFSRPRVLINPVIVELIDQPVEVEEGCLSLPGIYEKTMRYPEVVVDYRMIDGTYVKGQFAGVEAQVVQHECLHLDGKIFIDNIGPVRRNLIQRKIIKTLRQRAR